MSRAGLPEGPGMDSEEVRKSRATGKDGRGFAQRG